MKLNLEVRVAGRDIPLLQVALLTRNARKCGFVEDIAGGILAVHNCPIFKDIRDNLQLTSVTPAAPSG